MSATIDPQIIAFAIVAAVVTVLPGADMALVARNVLAHGRRGGYVTSWRSRSFCVCADRQVRPNDEKVETVQGPSEWDQYWARQRYKSAYGDCMSKLERPRSAAELMQQEEGCEPLRSGQVTMRSRTADHAALPTVTDSDPTSTEATHLPLT
jgi:hypothetical protein